MSRGDAKHANSGQNSAGSPASAIPAPTPTDSGEMPVPLRPEDMREGDHIDLRVSSESQEHRFAFEPGAPLPARARRSPKPQTPASGVPEAQQSVPPVTGAEAIIASATVISPVSGTYLVSSEPIDEMERQRLAAAAHAAAAQVGTGAPAAGQNAGAYRHEERRRVPRSPHSAPRPSAQPSRPAAYGNAPQGYEGYDGTGYGTPPGGTPGQSHPAAPLQPAPQIPPAAPMQPAARRPVQPPPASPSTEPLDLRHLQGQPVRSTPDTTVRRRNDQTADWIPPRPAERQADSHLGLRSSGPAANPARRSLGSGPIERPGTALQLRSPQKEDNVANIDIVLKEAMQIDGAVGVALVDYTSGMTLGQAGGANLNLEVAAAGNTEVVRAKLRTMEALGLREGIEDILITLDTQYHLIRLITDQTGIGLFLYLALDKHRSNLALARRKLANLERTIEI
ncbi:hypothetical protein GCM10027456_27830 [Kineosporia babensis]